MNPLSWLRPTERTTRTPYGRVTYLARDVWHGRALARYGEWSEAEVALWRRLVKPGATVVDAGAHIGCHTLALASLVGPLGRVLAFEPQGQVHDLLKRNVEQNGCAHKVSVYHCALGAALGWTTYAEPDYARAGNFGGVAMGTGTVRARVATLDTLELPALAFLKIDVEGAEVDVLNGARDTIRRCRPIIYAENDRAERSAQLLRVLSFLGYKALWHLPPLFNPANFKQNPVNVFGPTVSVNVLALPVERYADLRTAAGADPHLYSLSSWRYNAAGQLMRSVP